MKMCKSFSCIATRTKVYWKTGIDGHSEIIKQFKIKEKVGEIIKIEITPDEGYLHPEQKWTLQFDEDNKFAPEWWKKSHEKMTWEAFQRWKKEVYSKINLKDALFPINPLKIKEKGKPTKKDIELLKEWASVRASVRDSVWDSVRDSVGSSVRDSVWDSVGSSVRTSVWDSVGSSVRDSVGSSVRDSVWDSVRDSVGYSVRDSVGAYIGSLFKIPRKGWKYTDRIKSKDYPFKSCIDLWKRGLIPSFDGKIWRLHSGPKMKIIYEWKGVG